MDQHRGKCGKARNAYGLADAHASCELQVLSCLERGKA
jgi:hypothetical protein